MGFPRIKNVNTIQLNKCEIVNFNDIITSTKNTNHKNDKSIDMLIKDIKTNIPKYKNLKKNQIIHISNCNVQIKTSKRTNKIENVESVTAICPIGDMFDPTGKLIKNNIPITNENLKKIGKVSPKKTQFYKDIRQISYESKNGNRCQVAFKYKDKNNETKYKIMNTNKLFVQNRFKK